MVWSDDDERTGHTHTSTGTGRPREDLFLRNFNREFLRIEQKKKPFALFDRGIVAFQTSITRARETTSGQSFPPSQPRFTITAPDCWLAGWLAVAGRLMLLLASTSSNTHMCKHKLRMRGEKRRSVQMKLNGGTRNQHSPCLLLAAGVWLEHLRLHCPSVNSLMLRLAHRAP